MQNLIDTAGRLVANRSVSGYGVTAPYGKIDDTGRVELSTGTMKKMGAATATKPIKTSKAPERKIREIPIKKVSHVCGIQKINQIKINFTGLPDTDMRACFNRSTWSPAMNMQQPPLGTSHLILDDSLVKLLQNLRT